MKRLVQTIQKNKVPPNSWPGALEKIKGFTLTFRLLNEVLIGSAARQREERMKRIRVSVTQHAPNRSKVAYGTALFVVWEDVSRSASAQILFNQPTNQPTNR
jgi:hypothetical protein